MKISKRAQYGLRAMVYMAKNQKKGNVIPLKETSKAEAIPFNFLEKIIGQLEKAGLVSSKKGVQGGYILAKKSKNITAKDIVEALENTTAVDCSFCGKSKKCLTKNVWRKIDYSINKTLKSITLARLIR
ncbi:MAG: Rrf2 family transcriptional regulator [bacterium]